MSDYLHYINRIMDVIVVVIIVMIGGPLALLDTVLAYSPLLERQRFTPVDEHRASGTAVGAPIVQE